MSDDAREIFLDRFGSVLRDSGIPPMPAMVFAHVVADQQPEYTAAELADALGASPAAISGAVNYLVGVDMLERARRPGDRRHYFRLAPGDPWATMIERRRPIVVRWYESLAHAATDLPRKPGEAGRQLELGALFFAFMAEELPGMLERWQAYRDDQMPGGGDATGR